MRPQFGQCLKWLFQVCADSRKHRLTVYGRGEETLDVLHDEHRWLVAGENPQVFLIKKVSRVLFVGLQTFPAYNSRPSDKRVGLTRRAANQKELFFVAFFSAGGQSGG